MNKKISKLAEDLSRKLDSKNITACAVWSWKVLQHNGGLAKLDRYIEDLRQAEASAKDKVFVRVFSARILNKKEHDLISQNLEKKMNRDITADFSVDRKIIGGAVIKTKDEIFDLSWRGKLEQLKINLEGA